MKKYAIGWLVATLCMNGLSARTWTSADGEKTFEAKYSAYDAEAQTVTVVKGYQKVTFALDKLSESDREWVEAEAKRQAEEIALRNAPSVEDQLEEQVVGKPLKSGVLERLDGKRFVKAELEKAPEYYLLYFSASW